VRAVRGNPDVETNYERALAAAGRSDVLEAWAGLRDAITSRMDPRRYELVTLAAARRLRSSYCSLAHGKVLLELGEPVREIASHRRAAGLDEVDLALMDFAEQVVDDASSIGDSERQRLRDLGLSDAEIMDVALAASARCFFSKALDAIGVLPDASFRELGPELQELLVVGRPIAEE
jgi:alkylhydroperoxidase family enzyme